MSDVTVDYDRTDFLYYKYAYDANTKRELYSCTDQSNNIRAGTTLSNTCEMFPNLKTNSAGPCSTTFSKSLCNNKRYADKLLAKTINHSGADELYKNTTSQYNIERLSFINLGIGILASLAFIIKYTPLKN
jgi:hypothetical protein